MAAAAAAVTAALSARRRFISCARTAAFTVQAVTAAQRRRLALPCHPLRSVAARCLFSSSRRKTDPSSLQQLEASLVSQLPSSSSPPLSSCLPVVRQLLDVYLAQFKHADAERLLWRLCDEQTRGGTASTTGAVGEKRDEEAIDALRTMASLLSVRRAAAAGPAATAAASTTADEATAVLDDLLDRYNTLTASASRAVMDHPAHVTFVAAFARAYIDEGDSNKAQRILRSALLYDEKAEKGSMKQEAELDDGGRLRYATAYNFLGIAAYSPPEHVHSDACQHGHGHGHEHGHDELRQYDWSESEEQWERALAYLRPFVARLSSSHTAADVAAVFTPDSVPLHLLRTYTMTEDNISQAQYASGKQQQAVATLQRSIAALFGLLPSHHPELLRMRHRLIRLHLAADGVSEAQKECEPILSLDHRLLSLELTSSLDDLAEAFFRLRHYQYAARLFRQCIAVREAAAVAATAAESSGEAVSEASGTVGDLITASRLNDLAMCELKLNSHAAAEEHLRRSIAMKESILGPDHWECAVSVHNLGAALMGQRRYDEAERELQRARRLYQSKYERELSTDKDRDAVQAIVASHLGQCYALMERWSDSVAEYERAVAIKQRSLGDHPSVAMDLTQLGGVLLQAGQSTEAVLVFERVKEMAERLYGDEHTNVAVALHWLAMAEGRAGRLDEALKHARQAVAQAERLHAAGTIQLSTVEVMKKNLTEQLAAADRASEASGKEHKQTAAVADQPYSR